MELTLIIALLLVSSVTSGIDMYPPQATLSRANEVIQIVKAFDDAWDRKDLPAVERILARDYVYFSSEGRVWSRRELLDLLRSPKYFLTSAERSELAVHRNTNTAVVSSRWKGYGTYEGKRFRDDQRCSLVLTREGKSWKVLSEHCTQIVPSSARE